MLSKVQLLDLLAEANSGQPEFRQLSYKALVSAAYRAEMRASSDDELESLLKDFADFAVSSANKTKYAFIEECADLLPTGHPMTEASLEERLAWVEADPELSNHRALLASAVKASGIDNSHAWVRLNVLLKSRSISKDLVDTISDLELEASRG